MKFLTNAPQKKRKARFKKGSAAAKRYMASIRPSTKGGRMAKKRKVRTKRARAVITINPPKRHRRNPAKRHRRNPPKRHRRNPGMGGIMFYLKPANLINGAIDASEVLVGKVVVRAIPPMVGLPSGDTTGLLVQALTAVLAGGVAHAFVSSNAGKMVLAGGLAAPLETLVKGLNIPMISANLGEETVEIDGMRAYPQIPQGVGSYPQFGESEAEYLGQQ